MNLSQNFFAIIFLLFLWFDEEYWWLGNVRSGSRIVIAVVVVGNDGSLDAARLTRQHLIQKYIKTLNKEEGAIRLVNGANEFEG